MAAPTNNNQLLISGNYGEIRLNNQVIAGFQNWTLNYSVNLSQEGQTGTGTPILVAGLNSISITVSKLMMYGSSVEGAGFEPSHSLNEIALIPAFETDLYETIENGVVATASGCLFDSKTINFSRNQAAVETVTIMGTDVAVNKY